MSTIKKFTEGTAEELFLYHFVREMEVLKYLHMCTVPVVGTHLTLLRIYLFLHIHSICRHGCVRVLEGDLRLVFIGRFLGLHP